MHRIEKTLYGNGQPGLLQEMVKVREQMRLLLGIVSVLGSGTLMALVGIFFRLATKQ